MRPWMWAGVALLLAAAGGFFGSRALDAAHGRRVQAYADSLVAEYQHQADSIFVVAQDSARAATAASRRADSLAVLARRQTDSVDAANALTKAALAMLDSVTTAADSLAEYRVHVVPALERNIAALTTTLATTDVARREDSTAYQMQVRATAKLDDLLSTAGRTIQALRDSMHGSSVAPLQPFTSKLGNVATTAALATATVYACKAHVLSLGCLVGTAATIRRIW